MGVMEEKEREKAMVAVRKVARGKVKGKGKSRALVELLDRQGKGKGKGKGGKGKGSPGGKGGKGGNASCPPTMPSAEDILAEVCMFTSMGWIDTDMLADEGQITGDIMTLPNEISEALTGDTYATCVEDFEADAMGYEGCMDGFADEEKQQLADAMSGVGRIMCFKSVFEESCGLYMSNTMASMAGIGNTGSGSA